MRPTRTWGQRVRIVFATSTPFIPGIWKSVRTGSTSSEVSSRARMLARHWTDASVQEQDEFVFLFTSLLVRVYMSTIGPYPLTRISFQGESVRWEMVGE